jgi:hypothetical protein
MGPYKQVAAQVAQYAPAVKKDMQIIIAEYGAFDWGKNGWGTNNDMGHAMCNFDITGNQLLEERIPFSCYWTTRWIYDQDHSGFNSLDDNNKLLPVGWTLKFWCNYLFPEMVAIQASSDILTVFSSHNPTTNEAYVYIMNKDSKPVKVGLEVKNKEIKKIIQMARMYGKSPDDFSPVVNTNTHQVKKEVELPAFSINIYKLKMQ